MSGTCNDEMQMRMNEEVNVNLKETRTVQQKNYSRYAERTEKRGTYKRAGEMRLY